MFTGLVESIGKVIQLKDGAKQGITTLEVKVPADFAPLRGDSICVNGCCLSVASIDQTRLTFDCSRETLQRTALGALQAGDHVNLEQALQLQQRLGGHLVSGHIDTVGTVTHFDPAPDGWLLQVSVPRKWGRYLHEKGSVTIQGVSVTVNSSDDQPLVTNFSCMIIPITLEKTNLSALQAGSTVALEFDQLAKMLERLVIERKLDTGASHSQLRC